mmetsp:Transcript_37034/g.82331  ORF Transcript_37034/g.82331 Transcript_37034/m.82331 type:complete len:87 (+) Transcript_37034:325-585(+)
MHPEDLDNPLGTQPPRKDQHCWCMNAQHCLPLHRLAPFNTTQLNERHVRANQRVVRSIPKLAQQSSGIFSCKPLAVACQRLLSCPS